MNISYEEFLILETKQEQLTKWLQDMANKDAVL
jgi:hypothetical protein